jgi:hypothetical protein
VASSDSSPAVPRLGTDRGYPQRWICVTRIRTINGRCWVKRRSVAAGLICLLFAFGGGAVHNLGMEEEQGHSPPFARFSLRRVCLGDRVPSTPIPECPAKGSAIGLTNTGWEESGRILNIRGTLFSLSCLWLV